MICILDQPISLCAVLLFFFSFQFCSNSSFKRIADRIFRASPFYLRPSNRSHQNRHYYPFLSSLPLHRPLPHSLAGREARLVRKRDQPRVRKPLNSMSIRQNFRLLIGQSLKNSKQISAHEKHNFFLRESDIR